MLPVPYSYANLRFTLANVKVLIGNNLKHSLYLKISLVFINRHKNSNMCSIIFFLCCDQPFFVNLKQSFNKKIEIRKKYQVRKLTIYLVDPPISCISLEFCNLVWFYDYTIFKNWKGTVLFYEQVLFLRVQRMSQHRLVSHSVLNPEYLFLSYFTFRLFPTQRTRIVA